MGSNPSLVVRVAANLEELRANLAEGKAQIETTTQAMSKLATSFSGERLIQQAQNVVAAVNEIGGASKLTATEQERVNGIVERALEKYAALGRQAPPGMRELADETKRVDTASNGLTDTVKQLVAGFAAMFTARAAFNFVRDTINEASALKDLSQQTHINVEDLQLLAGGMSEFGVDADTLGKGLYKLSRGIAGGDDSVSRGLHMMGMSLQDVDGLNGKELFLKIEAGLATLQGGLRDTAAAELFGGKLGSAMAGAAEGIDGALEHWQRLNHVASSESVDAMDEFGESIERANKNLGSIAANMIGPVAQGFNVLNNAADHGASKWSLFVAMTRDYFDTQATGTTQTGHLTKLLDELNQKTEAATATTIAHADAHKAVAAAVDQRSQAVKFMAALEADAAVTLSAAQVTDLEHLKEIGALNAQNAAAIGISAAQYAKYTAELERSKKAMEEAKTIAKEYDAIIAHMDQVTFALAMEHEKQWRAEQLEKAKLVNAAVVAELDARVRLNATYGLSVDGQMKVTNAAETLRISLEKLHREQQTGISQAAQEQELMDAYTKALYDEAVAQDKANEALARVPPASDAANRSVQQFTNTLVLGIDNIDALNAALSDFYDQFAGNSAGTPGGGNVGTPVGNSAGMPRMPGHRAAGGPVSAGAPYIVGEVGPELFVPSTSGTIVPNGAAGGITVHNTIYVTQPFGTPAAIAEAIGDVQIGSLKNQGQRLGPVGA
jgi:hypothetical protein